TSFVDPVVDLAARAHEQADRDVGEPRLELTDEHGKHVLSGDRTPPDGELTAHASLELLDRLLGLTREREDPSGVAEQELAGWRRRRAATHAVEQRQADFLFPRAAVLGNSAMCQEQRLVRSGS